MRDLPPDLDLLICPDCRSPFVVLERKGCQTDGPIFCPTCRRSGHLFAFVAEVNWEVRGWNRSLEMRQELLQRSTGVSDWICTVQLDDEVGMLRRDCPACDTAFLAPLEGNSCPCCNNRRPC
jgi:hypothetical protein